MSTADPPQNADIGNAGYAFLTEAGSRMETFRTPNSERSAFG